MSPELVVIPAFLGTISFVIWTVANAWQRRDRFRVVSEFNSRLLDRLGSMKDFSDFLQTDGGKRLMDALTVERGMTDARDRILRATQASSSSRSALVFSAWVGAIRSPTTTRLPFSGQSRPPSGSASSCRRAPPIGWRGHLALCLSGRVARTVGPASGDPASALDWPP